MARPRDNIRQDCFAGLERIAAEVVTIHLDQVERIEERAAVMAAITDVIEAHHAVAVTDHRLAIDDAGRRAQTRERFDN